MSCHGVVGLSRGARWGDCGAKVDLGLGGGAKDKKAEPGLSPKEMWCLKGAVYSVLSGTGIKSGLIVVVRNQCVP